jgi:ABC-type dipeptide/oligopeptide/nickel transport system permease subunit
LVSGWFLVAFVALVLVWPFVSPYSPIAVSDLQSIAPNSSHWFGTDVHGRDLLTRIFYGARISLLVGAVGAAVSLIIGADVGTRL